VRVYATSIFMTLFISFILKMFDQDTGTGIDIILLKQNNNSATQKFVRSKIDMI